MTLETLETALGYQFKKRTLLESALTHSSFSNESKGRVTACNERLEFLGDSVLGFTIANYLYAHYPNLPEGQLTKLRAELVCEPSLLKVANRLQLGAYLRLGKGEDQNGGRTRASILADAVEALFAAILLDSNIHTAESIVLSLLDENLKTTKPGTTADYKTALQELVQRKSDQTLSYHLLSATGPDHQKVFQVEVQLNGKAIGTGSGKSKKEAEQAAAGVALETLEN